MPQDVLVIGFDDFETAGSLNPPLTTVHIPNYELGRHACEILIDLLDGKPAPMSVVQPLNLVVRQSCGCPSPAVEKARTPRIKLEQASHAGDLPDTPRSLSLRLDPRSGSRRR